MREADSVLPSFPTSPVVVFRDVSESSDSEGLQGTKNSILKLKAETDL